MEEFLTHFGYWGILLVLLAGGFGMPLPEDVPLMVGGYLCGQGYTRLEIMLPMCFIAVMGGDSIMYWLGRRYGHHVPNLPIVRRFLTPKRLAQAEGAFHGHGGKTLFTARFLPGLRTPIFFTAGVFKIPYWKMLVFDGAAALISVPVIILAAWYFSDQLEKVRQMVMGGQIAVISAIVVAAVVMVAFKLWRRRRRVLSSPA